MSTKITRSKKFDKQLEKVPDYIQKKFKLWVFLVELNGIGDTMKSAGYHDEPLRGQRYGQRSVRLNSAYRLIYQVIQDYVHIKLLEVHKHDY